jgi:hypothetical protein
VFPMALHYVEVVHRRRSRRLQPTPAHAANVLGSLFAGIRTASHRLPSQGGFRPHLIDQKAHALVVGRIQP